MNKQSRWWDFSSILFLSIAILIGSIRLAVTNWTDNLEGATFLTAIGLVLGLALGYSRFSSRLVNVFAAIYSLFFIPWFLGTTMPKSIAWNERLLSLLGRYLISLEQFFTKKPVDDSILFLTSMLVIFWTIAILAGYHMTRYGRPWIPLAAAGVTLFLVEYYIELFLPTKHSAFFIIAFLLSTLLLITHLYFFKSSRQWQSSGVLVEAETRYDLARGAFTAAAILLLIAWNIPTISRILTPGTEERATFNTNWDKFASQFQNAVAPLSGPKVVEVSYVSSTSTLGTGQPLSDAEVFKAETSLPATSGMVYYWRARSYDSYQNGMWESTITNKETYTPDSGPIPYADWYGRAESQVFITVLTNLRSIYIPGQPITLSRPSELVMLRLADDTVEINSVTVNPIIRPGELFETRVSVANPTIIELRGAGKDYPTEITDRYLQLPRSLPSRIKTLAEKIAGDLPTPYDQAAAITTYLRNEMTYVSPIPEPPSGQDPVDWFLFKNKQGFCQYYASAEVLLLRSLGIPARYSVGYAQGEPDETRTNFIVREKESHAWPEVYFPGIGWVEFEPTVVLSSISRESGENAVSLDRPSGEEEDAERITSQDPGSVGAPISEKPTTKPAIPTRPVRKMLPIYIGAGLFTSGALAGLIFLNRRRLKLIPYWTKHQLSRRHLRIPLWLNRLTPSNEIYEGQVPQTQPLPILIKALLLQYHIRVPKWLQNWAAWSEMGPFERAFSNVHWAVMRLGSEDNPTHTPAERIENLTKLLPESTPAAMQLLAEYQTATYGKESGDIRIARQAGKQIHRLGFKAWMRDLFGGDSVKKSPSLHQR